MRSRRSIVLAATCGVLTLALGLGFVGDHGPSGVDDVARDAIAGWPHGVLRALVLPTEPYVLVPVLALLVAWCVRAARRRDAVVVVVGPPLAVAVNTWVLKPVFDRWKGDTLVYPSGHTVAVVSTLVVGVVVAHGVARTVTVVVGAVLYVGVAVGMVGLGYHYVTDVVGGALFAVFVVLLVRESFRPRDAVLAA